MRFKAGRALIGRWRGAARSARGCSQALALHGRDLGEHACVIQLTAAVVVVAFTALSSRRVHLFVYYTVCYTDNYFLTLYQFTCVAHGLPEANFPAPSPALCSSASPLSSAPPTSREADSQSPTRDTDSLHYHTPTYSHDKPEEQSSLYDTHSPLSLAFATPDTHADAAISRPLHSALSRSR